MKTGPYVTNIGLIRSLRYSENIVQYFKLNFEFDLEVVWI